ncbi:MAG: choice-of-anchor B family protein [Gemmatimonadota bacterium]|nr:choice-of-anchor B family protein [Gemmatimonadota bacterium]
MVTLRTFLLSVLAMVALAPAAFGQSGSFGNAVIVDGDALIIGEPNNTFRPGTVYIYRRGGDGWAEARQFTAPDAERADGFGAAMALADNTLLIASRGGSVFEYERDGDSWAYRATLADDDSVGLDPRCNYNGYCATDFGIALAASGDWVLLGQANAVTDQSRLRPRQRRQDDGGDADPAGLVIAYQRGTDGAWTERQRLQSPASAPGDGFGAAMAVVGDRLLVGAPRAAGEEDGLENAGRVFEYRLTDGRWEESGELMAAAEDQAAFGSSMVASGARAVVGAPFSNHGVGAAYVFGREGGTWSLSRRLEGPESGEGDVFGAAVALDGEDVWVGAPVTRGLETGMAVVFGQDGTPSTVRFTPQETNHEDSFGHRVTANGGIAAVTASGLDHQAGGVFVYERRDGGGWEFVDELVGPPDALGAVVGEERRCTDGAVESFECDDVELLAYIPSPILTAPEDARGVRVNDNWGWTDPETGREYALIGRNDGTSFLDITDPTNPRLLGDLPKTPETPRSQLWRDIKTFKNYAFIVADGAGAHGMQVFDLTRLRSVPDAPVKFEPDLLYRGEGNNVVESSHNIIINEETGFAFLTSRGCAGMHMVDINEPLSPEFVGCSEPGPTHDAQCIIYQGPDAAYRGREICLRMAGDRFQISDVTNKSDPVELATASHPNPAYMHQGWVTEDHRYFIMDDESDVIAGNVATTRTLIWNLDNLEDPVLVKEFFGSLPASAHNLYVKGDFTYQANYKYGLHILDTSDPLNPVEVGMFDTSPYGDGAGFGGAWSNYPFFESGSIIVTSMQEGLFVLKKRPRPVS